MMRRTDDTDTGRGSLDSPAPATSKEETRMREAREAVARIRRQEAARRIHDLRTSLNER
jgi:hypothetical protein